MKNNLTRKEGIPCLAYAAYNIPAPWPCILKIVNSDMQFGVFLEFLLPSSGIDDKHLFHLRYEGDNLVPGENSLTDIDIPLSTKLTLSVLRHNNAQPLTLSLTLKQPCSVWCPKGSSSFHDDFPKLLKLARSRKVCIFFDTNWLGNKSLAQIQSILQSSQEFVAVPILPQLISSHQKADWSILNFIPDAEPVADAPIGDPASEAIPSVEHAEAVQSVIPEDPPSYEQVSSKRSRGSGLSPAPGIPMPKRFRHLTNSPSPDRATAASQLSPTSTVKVDIFQDTVTSAVEKALPVVLPDVFGKFLQEIRAGHSPSPSSSPTPPYTRISNAPTHHSQTPSRRFTHSAEIKRILNSVVTQAFAQSFDPAFARAFDQALDQALDQASDLYNSASIKIDDCVAESRSALATVSEDHKADFDEYCNQKLEEFEQVVAERMWEVEAQLCDTVLKASDKLDTIDKQALSRSRCLLNASGRQSALTGGRRATSLPLLEEDKDVTANEE